MRCATSIWSTGACLLLAAAWAARGEAVSLRARLEADWARQDGVTNATPEYLKACAERRARRLADVPRRIVFVKHFNLNGSHYAYTEAQSDAQAERTFVPGAALCLLTLPAVSAGPAPGRATSGDAVPRGEAAVGLELARAGAPGGVRPDQGQAAQGVAAADGLPVVETLLETRDGVIRDPDVSYDGARILFAWKKSDRGDDYHLYEMDVATRAVRQLTAGEGVADYEGCYLPGGAILFNSTRCVQTVDCWWTEVSNLYACDRDGRNIRRIAFDQEHDNFPTVAPDGRVLYTRWDYNDRGQIYPQGLFEMNPNGTGQREFYGNNSWFPTTLIHARGIPGSSKVLAVATGHHSDQSGKLIAIDPRRGRQENAGAQLIAPVRPTPAVRVDAYGQDGDQFQHPYPLGERTFLVSYAPDPPPRGGRTGFGLYWMDVDGNRELLAWDEALSCARPVPLAARSEPAAWPSRSPYAGTNGVCYVQDVYAGPGMAGVPRGTVKRLRVVALEFRAAGVGSNGSRGPAGGALASTPVSTDNGTWDVKRVLGSVPVEEDGSAHFQVPARTPVYFQLVDARGCVVQTMRSWTTLQPGERQSCVGCHEDKNSAPPAGYGRSLAARLPARALEPFHGPARGFSYAAEVQPVWDRHCNACHNGGTGPEQSFSLLATPVEDKKAKRYWTESYLNLTRGGPSNRWVNWVSVQSTPSMLPPYAAGAAHSPLLPLLEQGHRGVKLAPAELEKVACWIDLLVPFCGDYREAAAWTPAEHEKYERYFQKRLRYAREEGPSDVALNGATGQR